MGIEFTTLLASLRSGIDRAESNETHAIMMRLAAVAGIGDPVTTGDDSSELLTSD